MVLLVIWLLLILMLAAAVEEVGRGVYWVSGSGSGRKRIRLNRKTPAHLAGYMSHSRPRGLEEVEPCWFTSDWWSKAR